jgi:hypothetical protein
MNSTAGVAGLPPWGRLDEQSIEEAEEHEIPAHWQDNEMPWRSWRSRVIDVIDGLLWPAYQRGGVRWISTEIHELHEADFALLAALHDFFPRAIEAACTTTVRHADFFDDEDQHGIALGRGYERYDPQLSHDARQQIPGIVLEALRDKAGTVSTQLKQVFQRPRPYQVALLQDRAEFRHVAATTANTPSLISGHCFQGAMTGCNMFAKLGQHMSAGSKEVLQQFTVDIGDRRVFAGLHYPSDNLSSWFTALELVPHVFPPAISADVKAFLWSAISTKSVVYRTIRDYASVENSPYGRMLEMLEQTGLQ